MIRDREEFERFERDLIRSRKADPARNFRIVNALYREAVALGVLPPKDPLEGIETAIRIARAVNSVRRAP